MKQKKFTTIFQKYPHILWIVILFFVTLLFMIFAKIPYIYGEDDIAYHYHQVNEMVKSMDDSLVPSYIAPDLGYGYGYGAALFYPPLSHLLTAYLVKITSCDIFIGIYIIAFVSFFLSGLAMYFLADKLLSNHKIAFFCAMIYLFIPYHLADAFVRGAYAETWIFVFAPLIMNGFIELLRGNEFKFYLFFVLGYVLGVYSHYLTMVYASLFLIPFFIIYRKQIFTKEKIKCLGIASLLILGLISPLMIRIIEHRLMGDYRVFHSEIMVRKFGIEATVVSWLDYFLTPVSGFYLQIPIFLGYEIWALLLGIFAYYKTERQHYGKPFLTFFWTFVLGIFFLSSHLFWKILPSPFKIIQFVWRLEIILCFTIPVLVGYFVKLCSNQTRNKIIVFCSIVVVLSGCGVLRSNVKSFARKQIEEEKQFCLGEQMEYLPLATDYSYLVDRNPGILLVDGMAEIDEVTDTSRKLSFTVIPQKQVTLELPRIYYLGYVLKDSTGKKYPVEESSHGFLEVTLSKQERYTLSYQGTIGMHVSHGIMVLTTLFFFFLLYKKRKKTQMISQ